MEKARMEKGIMIALEGNDGAGKTTAARKLEQILMENGYKVLLTREPGGNPIAEQIRTILLDVQNEDMDARTEALLYAAARRQHLVQTILPALEQGTIVLCDRFLDSSLAYQGAGRNLGMDAIEQLNDFGLEGFRPDLTLFFSLDQETARKRMERRGGLDRMDQEQSEFHQRVRDGFEKLSHENPDVVIIDAALPEEEVARSAWRAVQSKLSHD